MPVRHCAAYRAQVEPTLSPTEATVCEVHSRADSTEAEIEHWMMAPMNEELQRRRR